MGKDDKAKKGKITFRPGKNGLVEAVRDGRVIGYVRTNDYQPEEGKQGKGR